MIHSRFVMFVLGYYENALCLLCVFLTQMAHLIQYNIMLDAFDLSATWCGVITSSNNYNHVLANSETDFIKNAFWQC